MPRPTRSIQPLFQTDTKGKITKDDTKKEDQEELTTEEIVKEETTVENQQEEQPTQEPELEEVYEVVESESTDDDYIQRFKKAKLKMETHQPFNTRIPKTLRKRIDAVEKYYTGGRKNTGFLQEFTANALRAELEKAEKQMEEEKKRLKAKNKKA